MSHFDGIACECDAELAITAVLHAGPLAPSAVVGKNLVALVDEHSVQKCLQFGLELRANQAVFDWELNVNVDGEPCAMYFSAARTRHGEYVIAASAVAQRTNAYLDEFMRINNEMTTVLRADTKSRLQDQAVYAELMALNNEMATLQRDLQKKNKELEELNLLKNQFVGMAAHDLRNPLGAFYSLCGLLADQYQEGDLNHMLVQMQTSAGRMLQLVNDLLDVSHIESGGLRLVLKTEDLGALVHSAVELNALRAATKRISIHVEPIAETVRLTLDQGKILQVLDNLLTNAIKFTPVGGRIGIRITVHPTEVAVAVQDSGVGIPAAEIPQLFKAFGRTSARATAGEHTTGLGLVISKRIVEGHGGTIEADSTLGEGSVFTVRLPYR